MKEKELIKQINKMKGIELVDLLSNATHNLQYWSSEIYNSEDKEEKEVCISKIELHSMRYNIAHDIMIKRLNKI